MQSGKHNDTSSGGEGAILGAAFLMATSAIGPAFLNNTSRFTEQLLTSFGFIILISVIIDVGAQLNIWRIITVSGSLAQDLSNRVFPGLGFILAALVAFGGLAFNIGNIAGCGLGLEVLTGLDQRWGAAISCIVALFIFCTKEAGKAVDFFVKILGISMIGLTLYVMFVSHPPFGKAIQHTFWPEKIDVKMIVALVGGTVGGYISFAGAHRLLDANVKGTAAIPQVNKSSVTGIVITAIMRYVLFLAALGVAWGGTALGDKNAAASVFQIAAGEVGYKFFGVVMWSAAITSVIGASYTSISFWKTFSPSLEKNQRWLISGFILLSTAFFLILKQPPSYILITAGVLNGLILPVALAIMLIAITQKRLFPVYNHPVWMHIAGWVVVALMTWMSFITIQQIIDET
ncbi:MAG TPA: NRAMP family divalent metal transporter [Chitinophagaceae bacterium]|nr:NRAMP family divalent metal transporter [Chitinophagaceae bacterium]